MVGSAAAASGATPPRSACVCSPGSGPVFEDGIRNELHEATCQPEPGGGGFCALIHTLLGSTSYRSCNLDWTQHTKSEAPHRTCPRCFCSPRATETKLHNTAGDLDWVAMLQFSLQSSLVVACASWCISYSCAAKHERGFLHHAGSRSRLPNVHLRFLLLLALPRGSSACCGPANVSIGPSGPWCVIGR